MDTLALRSEKAAEIVREAVRGTTARHVRVALVLGAVYFLITVLVEWQFFVRFRGWLGTGIDFIALELGALSTLLAVSVADGAIAQGAGRRTAYVLAALVGCVATDLSLECLDLAILGPTRTPRIADGFATAATMRIYSFTHWLLLAGTGVFLYAQWRSARRMQEHLFAAELDRVRKARLALESRLQALQARVEPGFLFRTLSQVRDLYDRDIVLASVVRAANMLDDLIAYLRAAMPHMRDTSSTVEQEIALAYLDIARLRMDERRGVDVMVADGIGAARMPPMMLLPLIDDAVAACAAATEAKPTIRVDVRAYADRLHTCVIRTPVGSTQADVTSIANIRERLVGLYGTGASLQVAVQAGCIEARLDIPLEFAADGTTEEARSA